MMYDLDKLIEGREFIIKNIAALEEGLEKEKARLADYNHHIEEAQKILRMHQEARDENSG